MHAYQIPIVLEQVQFVDYAQDMGRSLGGSQVPVGNQRRTQRQNHTAEHSRTASLVSAHQPCTLSDCFSPHILRSCLC